jgi:hypothetical protein
LGKALPQVQPSGVAAPEPASTYTIPLQAALAGCGLANCTKTSAKRIKADKKSLDFTFMLNLLMKKLKNHTHKKALSSRAWYHDGKPCEKLSDLKGFYLILIFRSSSGSA